MTNDLFPAHDLEFLMHGSIPPLTSLRAFEAAARHLSLTKAAQELNVTAGALSHQIRGLEEFVGVDLFERRVRSIALTPAGEGAGVLLAHDLLAYDDLRTGRLVIPVPLALASGRAYHLVRAKRQKESSQMEAFSRWIREEVAALDWKQIRATAGLGRRGRSRTKTR